MVGFARVGRGTVMAHDRVHRVVVSGVGCCRLGKVGVIRCEVMRIGYGMVG